jgi:predicted RNA-binding protein with PUA domain
MFTKHEITICEKFTVPIKEMKCRLCQNKFCPLPNNSHPG